MRRFWLATLAAVGLAGCVDQAMNQGLGGLVGQNIRAAVSRLGYPDGKREMLGNTIYVWNTNRSIILPVPTSTTTTGYVGPLPVSGTTTGTAYIPQSYNCTLQIGTDQAGTIINYQWAGNTGGCARYANALKRRQPAGGPPSP